MTADRLLRPRLSDLWAFLAIALPVLAALVAAMPAVDLAYQLRAGGSILDGAGIPHTDTYTFTIPGAVWPDQQWGAQLLLGLAYRVAGWNGLAILRAVLVGATFGLLLRSVRRRAPQLPMRAAALLVLSAFLVAAPTLALRPQLFAMVLFAASLLVLADRDRHPGRVWLLPIFALLWANLHGSFPLAIVLPGLAWLADVSGVWASPGPVEGGARGATADARLPAALGRHTMLAVAAVSAVATLANPLGVGVWSYVVNLATNPTIGSRVSEWRPPGLTDAPGILFWLSVVAVVAFVAWRARRSGAGRAGAVGGAGGRRVLPPRPALLTLILFALLGAATGRGLAWWPLVAVVVCVGLPPTTPDAATGITGGNEVRTRARRGDQSSPLNAFVAGILIVAGIALLPLWRPLGLAGVPSGVLSYAPQGITQRLALFNNLNSHAATVWNPQVWGSWLEFAVPGELVAVDSRIELFPTPIWDDVDRVSRGGPDAIPILDRYNPDFVVVERPDQRALEAALSAAPAWACIYQDVEGSIWARSDTVLARGALGC